MNKIFYLSIAFLLVSLNTYGQHQKLKFGKYQLGEKLKTYKECKPPYLKIPDGKNPICTQEHTFFLFEGKSVDKSYLTFNEYGELKRIEYTIFAVELESSSIVDQVLSFVYKIEEDYKSFGKPRDKNPYFVTRYTTDLGTVAIQIAYGYMNPSTQEVSGEMKKSYLPTILFVALLE